MLAKIEDELFKDNASNLFQVVFKTMDNNPKEWINYYHGSIDEQQFLKHYSYSDRIRYYWDHPDVNSAINKMIKNLDNIDIPEFVISQFFGIATNEQNNETARSLIKSRIQYVVDRYYNACGLDGWCIEVGIRNSLLINLSFMKINNFEAENWQKIKKRNLHFGHLIKNI